MREEFDTPPSGHQAGDIDPVAETEPFGRLDDDVDAGSPATDDPPASTRGADKLPDEVDPAADSENDQVDDGEADDGEADGSEADDGDGRPRRLSSSQRKSRKIAALASQLADKEAHIAALTQQLESMADGTDPVEEPPRPENFASQEAYEQARAAHTTESVVRAVRKQDRQQATYQELLHAEQDRQLLARQHFNDRLEIAKPHMPDFDGKVRTMIGRLEAAEAEVPAHVLEEIQANSKGPEILYLMAGDDGFLLELLRSDPVSAARAIGRREALLTGTTTKTRTNAPAPRTAPRGGSGGHANPETMSYQDYRRWRGFDGAKA